MSLTQTQRDELQRLAKAGKMGGLSDLAARWGVDFRLVARTFAEYQKQTDGQTEPSVPSENRPQGLSDEQKRIIRRLAEAGNQARVYTLADDWGVDSKVIARFYSDCRAEMRGKVTIEPDQLVPAGSPGSPVADVVAAPGQIAVLPRSWALIQARLTKGNSPRDVALAVGMTQADYKRVEEGRQLPTADQAAKLCALFDLPMEQTFVVAGQEALYTRGAIRGLSLLGILRAKRRLSLKDLAAAVHAATGRTITTGLLSSIERGQIKQPLSTDHARQIEALATFFGLTDEVIMAQVPPSWIQTAAANTAAMNTALKAAVQSLPGTTAETELLIAATDRGDQA